MSSIPNSAMPHAKVSCDDGKTRSPRFAKARSGARSALAGALGLPITVGVVGAAMVVRLLSKRSSNAAPAATEPAQIGSVG